MSDIHKGDGEQTAASTARGSRRPPRVIVKFHDTIELPYADGIGDLIDERQIGAWKDLAAQFGAINIRRLYRTTEPQRILDLVKRATARDPTYRGPNLLTYFVVDCPDSVDPDVLADALKKWASVESAYREPVSSPPNVDPTAYGLSGSQGYLNPAPTGIDALFAYGVAGGDGAGQNVIDLETGWTLDHQDISAHNAQLLSGFQEDAFRPHGTEVLGVICGRNAGATAMAPSPGVVGIAPNVASVNVVSYKNDPNQSVFPQTSDIPAAIVLAAGNLNFGDVLVLEVEIEGFLPCEAFEACFDTITAATAAGIVVVQAAGNGNRNLDSYVSDAGRRAGQHIFDRATPAEFTDSGAIVVGAASSAVPHPRAVNSNFGNRIDCYAWGDSVETATSNAAGTNKTSHNSNFSQTSAATAIIAGAALSVQGMNEALNAGGLSPRLSPTQLRGMLSDSIINTASSNAADSIGVMPDLRAINAKLAPVPAPAAPTGLTMST